MKVHSKILVPILLLLLLLNGCSSALPPNVQQNLSEALAAIAERSVAAPVEPVALAEAPAEVKIITPSSEPVTSNCLTCHTDKETLIAVSAPVEEPEDALSSGVG
jgi:PBP1b-binding outer membrane lipoprotein LpoB